MNVCSRTKVCSLKRLTKYEVSRNKNRNGTAQNRKISSAKEIEEIPKLFSRENWIYKALDFLILILEAEVQRTITHNLEVSTQPN